MEKFGNSSAGPWRAPWHSHSGARSDPQTFGTVTFENEKALAKHVQVHTVITKKKFQRPNTWALPIIHSRESEFGRLLEDIWSYCSWTKAYLISLHEEKLITICHLQHLRNPISAGRSELSEVARHVGSSDDLAREAGDNDKLKKRERFNQVYW